jgi:hypothetical protein
MARLAAETERLILAAIRAGGYPASAAISAGIDRRRFARWLKKGRQQKPGWIRRLANQVDQAEAQARVRAEIDVREKDVKFWLRHGPAKQAWVPGGKRKRKTDAQQLNSAFFGLLARAYEVLQPFPDARQVLAKAFDQLPQN